MRTTPIEVRVARTDPRARAEFEVEPFEAMTVLDLLLAIQRDHDASIGFRYSCRMALCGTCTVRLDGTPVLACQTTVTPSRAPLRLEPLAGLPPILDLIVDMTPFFENWAGAFGYFVPSPRSGLAVADAEPVGRGIADEARACIACGACHSSCAVAGAGSRFLGPAALTRAMLLVADGRDEAHAVRMGAVTGAGGLGGCHYVGACSVVCPKGLDPAASIRRLRRWRVAR